MNLDFLDGIELTDLFTAAVRWVFVLLGIYILIRSIRSLLRTKNPAEVWAYMNLRTIKTDENGSQIKVDEISVPVTHWENVIGRAKNCDISVEDPTLSRNHGILMRDTKGEWIYRDLGSKNGTYLNDAEIGKGRSGRSAKKAVTT